MKNFTVNEYQSKFFIRNFTINNNIIEVLYADRHIDNYELNENNINMLFNRMEEQILNSNRFVNEAENIYNISKSLSKKCIIGATFILILSFLLNIYFLLFLSGILFGISRRLNRDYKIAEEFIDDYNKNKLFVDNKEMFNICNRIISSLLKKETYDNLIKRLNINYDPKYINYNYLNINSINNLTYDEVYQLFINTSSFNNQINEAKRILNIK